MNLVEFTHNKLNTARSRDHIISQLIQVQNLMTGRPCFDKKLSPGQASSFLIYSLQEYFESINKPFSTYLEVGVLFGGSLCALAKAGFKGTAYGCDIYEGYYGAFNRGGYPNSTPKNSKSHMELVNRNVQAIENSEIDVQLIKGSSLDSNFTQTISQKGIQPLDVLYIDGLHTEKGCNGDWDLYSPLVKSGGTVLVDNYEIPEVAKSVQNHIIPSGKIEEVGIWNVTTWVGIIK